MAAAANCTCWSWVGGPRVNPISSGLIWMRGSSLRPDGSEAAKPGPPASVKMSDRLGMVTPPAAGSRPTSQDVDWLVTSAWTKTGTATPLMSKVPSTTPVNCLVLASPGSDTPMATCRPGLSSMPGATGQPLVTLTAAEIWLTVPVPVSKVTPRSASANPSRMLTSCCGRNEASPCPPISATSWSAVTEVPGCSATPISHWLGGL